jgi:HSP20 family protein
MSLKSVIPVSRERATEAFMPAPFTSLQREIERLFDDFGRSFPSLSAGDLFGRFGDRGLPAADVMPRMNVIESDAAIELTAELPGLEQKDVEVNVIDDVLTIRGEKKEEKDEKQKDYRLVERRYGSFSRRVQLPAGVEADKITARIANGVLTVSVPKPAPAVSKTIEVKSAA